MKICKAKCWLAKDRKTIVEDGHEDAAFLFAIPGQHVPNSYVEKFGNSAALFFQDLNSANESALNVNIPHGELESEPGNTNVGGRGAWKSQKTEKKVARSQNH